MTQPDIIQTILKDSNYHLVLFSDDEIQVYGSKSLAKQPEARKLRL